MTFMLAVKLAEMTFLVGMHAVKVPFKFDLLLRRLLQMLASQRTFSAFHAVCTCTVWRSYRCSCVSGGRTRTGNQQLLLKSERLGYPLHTSPESCAGKSQLFESQLFDWLFWKKNTHSYLINCVPAKVTALWFMVLPKSHTHCWIHWLIALAKVTAVSVIVLPKKSHLFQLCGKITAEVTNSLCQQKSQLFDLLCCPKSPLFQPLCGKSHCWSHQLVAPASHSCSLFQQKSQLFLSLFQQKSLL